MARGTTVEVGTRRWSPNGYLYEKTPQGWELVHRLMMEEQLGRKLNSNEQVRFKDRNKQNFEYENLVLHVVRGRSPATRIAAIDAKIEELQAERAELEAQLL